MTHVRMSSAHDGWSESELAKMKLTGGGCLSETDGRNFMALLDMCHFLVDRITQNHNFPDLMASSHLRSTDTAASAMLTAQMYSYWDAAPAGPGVYEMLVDWTKSQPGVGAASRAARETGQNQRASQHGAALHALAVNECQYWPRRRKTGAFYFAGEDASGAALLADESLTKIYRVMGISTSVGDLIRAGRPRSGDGEDDLTGSSLLLTLLPFMGVIVYDGTLRGAPPNRDPEFVRSLRALRAAAEGERRAEVLVTTLPTVAETPLLRKRVEISGLNAKPELNGCFGIADSFDDASGRYCVVIERGGGMFRLKEANLSEAPPRSASEPEAAIELDERERSLQRRIGGLRAVDDFWVFRRMGYTEADNPSHMGMIMSGKSGMAIGPFESKQLAPTAAEYLDVLERTLFKSRPSSRKKKAERNHKKADPVKPSHIAVDEKGAVERLKAVLGPAGIDAGYCAQQWLVAKAWHSMLPPT